jgi:hypothetical protein
MASYTVIWWPPALADLTTLWIDAANRDSITPAANVIDQALGDAPSKRGREIHEGLRKLTVAPLSVQFSIDEQDKRVTIWSVRSSQ